MEDVCLGQELCDFDYFDNIKNKVQNEMNQECVCIYIYTYNIKYIL